MKIGWNVLPPLTFVAIVGAWSLAVRVFKIPAYLLPGPGPVFARLITDASMLWGNAMVTLTEIVLGFGLTLLSAIPLGLLIALSPVARQILYPPIVLLQLVPKIAVAPLFLVWLGFGIESKVRHRRRRASDVQAERAKPPNGGAKIGSSGVISPTRRAATR